MARDHAANRALLLISLGVLLASSTWFSGTAAAPDLALRWSLSPGQSAALTTSVQVGFIAGTLIYAAANLADVFNARRVFFWSALAGAAANAAFGALADGLPLALGLRFLTGVTLAGVYPVGMKLVATWFSSGLGWRLGVMVGALTLGTALPYLLTAAGASTSWQTPVFLASGAAVVGGLVVRVAVDDGPHLRERVRFDLSAAARAFRHAPFRNTALGYFGHMWELYALWSLVGLFVESGLDSPALAGVSSWIAFGVVAVGALGCVGGGWLSRRVGERRVALWSLLASMTLCLASPLLAELPAAVVVATLMIWGVVVVSDSPQFSALATVHAPAGYVGTALTIQNGVGFAITVASIQLVPMVADAVGWRQALVILALGPLLGALAVRRVPDTA